MNVSAVDSEMRENRRKRRMKGVRQVGKAEVGVPRQMGWGGVVVGARGLGGAEARWVISEEQSRGHGNTQSEVGNRVRREEKAGRRKFTGERARKGFSSGRAERRVEIPGLVGAVVDRRLESP